MPVLAREETALESVLALNHKTEKTEGQANSHVTAMQKQMLNTSYITRQLLLGTHEGDVSGLALKAPNKHENHDEIFGHQPKRCCEIIVWHW